MADHDQDTLARFARRFAGIEADVKDPPPLAAGRGTMHRLSRGSLGLAWALAVVAVVVAVFAAGPLIVGGKSDGPASTSGAVVGASPTPAPATPAGASPVLTVKVGDWSASCEAVEIADCQGAAERFINLLARSWASVFEQSGGLLAVTGRPVCPPVPDWADGSYCWQVSAPGASWSSTDAPVCMVIAKRGTDTRYPPYVQVGGLNGTGRAGGPPEGWPSCD